MSLAKLVYQRKNGKWEARYRKGTSEDGKAIYGTVYGDTEAEAIARRCELLGYDPDAAEAPLEMNLLIIGAGIHGRDCKNIAESLRIFKKIKFLDDNLKGEDIIGKTGELERFRHEFPCACVAIGDNEIRMRFAEKLKQSHFLLPSLVSPLANISSRAIIGTGTVIFPHCVINDCEIGDFCIIDTNTLVSSGTTLSAYTRVDCGGMVLKGVSTSNGTWVKSGEIYGSGEKQKVDCL